MKKALRGSILLILFLLLSTACNKTNSELFLSSDKTYSGEVPCENRAIGGISMGAYGSSNLGLKNYKMFNTYVFLGGLISMKDLLTYLVKRNRPVWEAPNDANIDHWGNFPTRQTLTYMMQDITLAYGNMLYNNPYSTFYPPDTLKEVGKGFDLYNPTGKYRLIDYFDGGDKNIGTNDEGVSYSNGMIDEDEVPNIPVKIMLAVDYNGNGKRDRLYNYAGDVTWSEPVANHCCEPFIDKNNNFLWDEGESFDDYGLDKIKGTNDEGEGNGVYDRTDAVNYMLENDPVKRFNDISAEELKKKNFYFDVGDKDDFEFYHHYTTFFKSMYSKGLSVTTVKGYPYDSIFPKSNPAQYLKSGNNIFFEYPGHHVGGVQGIVTRFIFALSFVSMHFPKFNFYDVKEGDHGTIEINNFISPSFIPGTKTSKRYGIYLPPGYYEHPDEFYPIFYFFPGYMQALETTAEIWFRDIVDYLIWNRYLNKMIIVFVDGAGGYGGCFYVNHVDDSGQDPGQYEDYIFKDLIPLVETHYRVAR